MDQMDCKLMLNTGKFRQKHNSTSQQDSEAVKIERSKSSSSQNEAPTIIESLNIINTQKSVFIIVPIS